MQEAHFHYDAHALVCFYAVPWCCSGVAVVWPLHPPCSQQCQHQHALLKQEEPACLSEQEHQHAQQGVASVTLKKLPWLSVLNVVSSVAQTCESTGAHQSNFFHCRPERTESFQRLRADSQMNKIKSVTAIQSSTTPRKSAYFICFLWR